MIGKVDALLRFGWAAIPARLRAGQDTDQPEQEVTHQLGTHGEMINGLRVLKPRTPDRARGKL